MYFGRPLIAAALALGATSAHAGPTFYDCEITNHQVRSYKANNLQILYDTDTGEARAVDGLIYHTYESDIPVKVVTDNAARITFQWDLKNVEGRSQGSLTRVSVMRQTVTLLKKTMTIQIRQRPMGYDNSYTGAGRCTATPVTLKRK